MPTLFAAARACLDAALPEDKLAHTFAAAEAFGRGELPIPEGADGPEPIRMPGRPVRPLLVHPRDLPRRGFGSTEGRAAFIHAVAHIEFNAIVVKELPDHPMVMTYDVQQIEQVLVNVITNAIQAMPGGGTLSINLSEANSMAVIAIQDTGTGIPPEHLTRIFDPFFTTKPDGEGTGLGLSVSYGIISNHSGRIDVESEAGLGSTFKIVLPMWHPELTAAQS